MLRKLMASISAAGGENSILIAPPADDSMFVQARSIPAAHIVNTTLDEITSIDLTIGGSSNIIVENIAPSQMVAAPDYLFKLPQAHEAPLASNFVSNPVTVNFKTRISFTLTVNISSALQSPGAVVLYVFQRGIVTATETGDLRAVNWVS